MGPHTPSLASKARRKHNIQAASGNISRWRHHSTSHVSRRGHGESKEGYRANRPYGAPASPVGMRSEWKGKELELKNPRKGLLPVQHHEGCPQVSKALALELIEEIEDKVQGLGATAGDFKEEEEWMRRLAREHPVLKQLPPWIKDRLAVTPGEWSGLPLNRKWRKRLKREGFILHLYAGGKEGFTVQRAFKQVGGDEGLMLEVDEKRGPGHDMLSDSQVYPSLLRAALEGKLKAIVGGPNCRTREWGGSSARGG